MGDRLRKLLERIRQNPKAVTPAELNRAAIGLGYEVVATKEGFKIKAPQLFPSFSYPKPHPGRHIKAVYVKDFLNLARVKQRLEESNDSE